jgi:hypothetical protein
VEISTSKVIRPASSFEATTRPMSGAPGSSLRSSAYVALFSAKL